MAVSLPPSSAASPEPAASATRDPLAEESWDVWLATLYRRYVSTPEGAPIPFADYHVAFWEWVWAISRGVRPRPFVAVWPRGAGKSTSAELAVVALGARRARRYALYLSETQEQADRHLDSIKSLLESPLIDAFAPELGSPLLSKFGHSRGWRRNRLRTAGGYTVDALGLDTAARGVKVDDARPDLIVLDDIDAESDSAAVVDRKILTLTRKILPTGSADVAILAVQNLIHEDSVFSRLVEGRAGFLAGCEVSGPHPAILGLVTERQGDRDVITHGTPTWAGLDLPQCQREIDDSGLSTFLAEYQHEVDAPAGGLFDHLTFHRCDPAAVPDLVRVVVWCDPAVTDTDQSDANGIQADGIALDKTVYRLWSWEQRASPQQTVETALLKAVELKAECVGVETNQGGETWESVYREAWRSLLASGRVPKGTPCPRFRSAKAGAGTGSKVHRASQMLTDYERGKIVHVIGTHTVLEKALRRFPRVKPLDIVDASYWSWRDLRPPTTQVSRPRPFLMVG